LDLNGIGYCDKITQNIKCHNLLYCVRAKGKVNVNGQSLLILIPTIVFLFPTIAVNELILWSLEPPFTTSFHLVIQPIVFLFILIPCIRIDKLKSGLKIIGIYVLVMFGFVTAHPTSNSDPIYIPTMFAVLVIPLVFSITTTAYIIKWSNEWNRQFS